MKADLKTIRDLNNPEINECPYCGCDTYFYNQSMKGIGIMNVQYDGTAAENGEMHEALLYTPTGKFAYCAACKKRVFRFKR
jgi:hypothetical protein